MAKGPSEKFKSSKKGGKSKTLSKSALSEVKQASDYAKKIGSDKTFSDLVKEYKQANVKYDRPATFREAYGEEVNKVGTPLASTYYKDPVTGKERFFTAQAPTIKQLMGDVGRAFSGYNTLSYDPNAQGIATTTGGQIVRQPGLLENFGIPYISTALKIGNAVSDAWNKVRGFFNPSQTPQGIETQFPRVSPEARGYFGGYNQGIPSAVELPPDFQMKQKPKPLTPSQMSEEQFQESFPELYSSLYQQRDFQPIRINNEGASGITNTTPIINNQYLAKAAINPYTRLYEIVKNPQLNTSYGNFRLDNALSGNRQLGYSNTVDMFGQPVDLNATIGNQGVNLGATFKFKNGGSVDKYSGLGYKFK